MIPLGLRAVPAPQTIEEISNPAISRHSGAIAIKETPRFSTAAGVHRHRLRPQVMGIAALLCLLGVFLLPMYAQNTSKITGAVTDPSGAIVPGVKVVATDVDKGFTYSTETGSSGLYTLENLPPSTYTLSFTATGFRTATRPGITVGVGQNATVNVELSLGSTAESITVTGVTPLLDSQDATTGQTVQRGLIDSLPLVGRSFLDLAYLSPGVNPVAGSTVGSGTNKFSSNGGRGATAAILLDGVPVTAPNQNTMVMQVLYTPSVEAVQEFKIEQNSFSADKGFSGNTVVNVVIRSGTNRFHGSAFEFLRNRDLNANNWFNNRAGISLPASRQNDFGFSVGGPIQKNKTFFFGDYEGRRNANAASYSMGVPSAAERKGDFGELCGFNGGTFNAAGACSKTAGQLWDPYSAIYNTSTGQRNLTASIPFNNLATYVSPGSPVVVGTPYQLASKPGNLIDPVAAKMMSYYPLPNLNVGTSSYNRFNNWASAGTNASSTDQFDIKVDRQISDMTHFDVRASRSRSSSNPYNAFGNPLFGGTGPNTSGATSAAIHLTHTFSPTLVLSASYGFTRYVTHTDPAATKFPSYNAISDLGLPAYMSTNGYDVVPTITTSNGYTSGTYSTLGNANVPILRQGLDVHNPRVGVSKFHGSHQFEFGAEMRIMRDNFSQPNHPGSLFTFNFTGTSRTPSASDGGDSLASFLTGLAASGDYRFDPSPATQSFDYAAWFQDNWHVTSKLTLNLGLRYELPMPRTERFNRVGWFDPTAVSPVSGLSLSPQAAAVYTQAGLPLPNLSTIHGGLEFASSKDRYPYEPNFGGVAPRFGFAYNLDKNTVVRGGYGIFYVVTDFTVAGSTGLVGFLQTQSLQTTYQSNGYTPFGRMSNPYPNGIQLPVGNSLGLATSLGLGISPQTILRNNNQLPYMQTWNFGLQHQFGSVLVEADYVGTKGTHLYQAGVTSAENYGRWIESASTDQITALNTYVPNPFAGVITTTGCTSICAATIRASALLAPFPQFSGVQPMPPPWGNSTYNALQLKVEKRLSRGLEVTANYVWSKAIDSASTGGDNVTSQGGGTAPAAQDPNNLRLERSISEFDMPKVLSFSYVYSLPFGRGQRWGGNWPGVVTALLGGWQTQGFLRFDSGQPLDVTLTSGLSNPLPTYGAQHPNLTATLKKNDCDETCMVSQYFANPSVLVAPPRYTLGNAPRTLGSVRAQGTNNANLSISKSFHLGILGESGQFQFRLETFNALNHVQFAAPNTAFGGGTFGQISSQANAPRQVQLGAKLSW
jgi:hypothetical protein